MSMPSKWSFSRWLGMAVGVAALAHGAKAQCNPAIPAAGVAAAIPSHPIQAEEKVTLVGVSQRLAAGVLRTPILIARDSQGHVRIDRALGKFKIETGPEGGTEVERHSISICDPAAQTWTVLDTLNKTATRSKLSRWTAARFKPESDSFCANLVKAQTTPTTQVENLGHKQLSGVDAEGWRFTRQSPVAPGAPVLPGPFVREEWCSEELAAIMLRVQYGRNNTRTETALVNLQRIEPDPMLFQIPPDYTVSERVPPELPPGPRLGTIAADPH